MFPILGQITLPDVGVDISGHITAVGLVLGGYVATAVGLWFAFRAILAGLRWARKV